METNIEIKEVTDIAELLKIVPFEVEVMKNEPKAGSMSLRDKITWIEAGLSEKSILQGYGFKVFFFYKGDDLVCFTVLSITKSVIKYFDEIRIYRVWHKDPECVDKFWELIQWLGKEHKIKKIRLETNRPSAERLFRRKYGLRSVSINMEGVI
jgi:hypothetical protein